MRVFHVMCIGVLSSSTIGSCHPIEEDQALDYIVVFRDHVATDPVKRDLHSNWISEVSANSTANFEIGKFAGYHGSFTKRQIKAIRDHEDIAYVEEDSYDFGQNVTFVQHTPPWGLARISHREKQYTNGDTGDNYVFDQKAGDGTTIYLLDTGIRDSHAEFTGRVRWGKNFVSGEGNDDRNGHGTHVAGTAAGAAVGVAKYAEIVPVKILDSQQRGRLSDFVKALEWVVSDHKSKGGRSIINYSAVGEVSQSRDDAIASALDEGLIFVGAAGNNESDACKYGPPNYTENNGDKAQLIVAGLNFTDAPADFTNHGRCVQIFAPGVNVNSSVNTGDTAYEIMSGTSMAAPHVAGLASYYWSIYPDYDAKSITDMIKNSNPGSVINNFPDTSNGIAYNGEN